MYVAEDGQLKRTQTNRPDFSEPVVDFGSGFYLSGTIVGMERSRLRACFAILMWLCVTALWGCVLRPGGAIKDPEAALPDRSDRVDNRGKTLGNGLIRPIIPPEADGQREAGGASKAISNQPEQKNSALSDGISGSASEDAGANTRGPHSGRVWEDQRVRQAALALAAKTPDVKTIKICLTFKTDEWLIVLYKDVGQAYELKQYFWKRDQPEPEPYLVFERIPKHRLEEHLAAMEPDRACETLDPSR